MATIEQARHLIENGDIDQIEDLWLSRQSESPTDIDYFQQVATQLVEAREADSAKFLLELLDEQLREGGHWPARLELLESCGLHFLEPTELHATALATLEHLYPDSKSLPGLIEKTGLRRAIVDTAKTWTKIRRLQSLMRFRVGTFVWMTGKGPGQVTEVNLELDSFKIDLRTGAEIRVGFAAAAKMLEALDPDHIERRKIEDLEALLSLKRDDPGQLLVLALESRGKPLAAAAIRQTVAGVVDDGEWSSWWQRARKHPRILTSSAKGRQTYALAASEDHALDDVRASFAGADIAEQLEILRKNAGRSPDLTEEMIGSLAETATTILHEDPATALETWFALERHGAQERLDWSPATVVEEAEDPAALATSLADRNLRERIYDLCWSERPDAPKVYRRAIEADPDPRLLAKLADRLGRRDAVELKGAVDDILGHPRRRPAAFVWLAESGEQIGAFAERNPLRVIRQILDALHQSEFNRFRARLQATFETGGGATVLFSRLTEEQASQAEQALKSAPLEEHLADSLVRYLHVRFPALDSAKEAPLYATKEALEERRRELERLQKEEIPANRKAIEEARELGDLRENFEYKSARQRHEYLNARLASLQSDLSRVIPLDPAEVDPSEARIGCRIELTSPTGWTQTITVLGPWESDPDNDIVSYDSELGQSLLGKKTGDAIELDAMPWTLTEISVWQ